MLPGKTIIRKCMACSKLIAQCTTRSGNTLGATYWTDGKFYAPMLPAMPELVKCPHCHESVWISDLVKIDEIEPSGVRHVGYKYDQRILDWKIDEIEPLGVWHVNYKDACEYEMPSLDDYFALLEKGFSDPEKEQHVRLCAWREGNNQRRTNPGKIPMSSSEISNLTALLQTLDESNDRELVWKAEVMRELGRFDDALSALAKSVGKDFTKEVEIIRLLSEQSDPYVRQIRC